VTSEINREAFGNQNEVVSGFAVAPSSGDAETLGQSFKLNGRLLRDSRESLTSRKAIKPGGTETEQAMRFEFSYTYYLSHDKSTISYTKEVSTNKTSLEKVTTYSGIAYGPTEALCNAFIDDLLQGENSGKNQQSTRTASVEKQKDVTQTGNAGAGTQVVSVSFTEQFIKSLDASSGVDIVEASWSLSINYSINKAVLTPIPYGSAHVQEDVGVTIGLKTASGSVTARNESTARQWARSKKTLATNGGYVDTEEERTSYEYPAMDGYNVKAHRVEFTYAARFPELFMN